MKPTVKVSRSGKVTAPEEHLHFDSLGELTDWLTEGKGTEEAVRADKLSMSSRCGTLSSVKEGKGESWDLGAGWEGAMEMALHTGWEKGAKKIRDLVERMDDYDPEVSESGATDQLGFRWDEEGEELDIAAFLEGDDRPWLQPIWDDTKPIVRILVDCGASCAVSAQAMEARGAVMAALCKKLERVGFGVQLYMGFASPSAGGTCCSVRIKDSDERVDEGVVAFWLAHPGAFRRIGFRMIEAMHVNVGSGYGIPGQMVCEDFDMVSASGHLNRADAEGWTNDPDAAAKATIELCNQILSERGTVAAEVTGGVDD